MYLLDTNIVSEWTKPRPSPEVARWLDGVSEEALHLSVVTFAEVRRGAALLPSGRKRRALVAWLEGPLTQRFAGRVLDIDRAVCDAWGDLLADSRRQGRAPGVLDGFIAATAHVHGLTLATRNTGDFAGLGVALFNPFQAR